MRKQSLSLLHILFLLIFSASYSCNKNSGGGGGEGAPVTSVTPDASNPFTTPSLDAVISPTPVISNSTTRYFQGPTWQDCKAQNLIWLPPVTQNGTTSPATCSTAGTPATWCCVESVIKARFPNNLANVTLPNGQPAQGLNSTFSSKNAQGYKVYGCEYRPNSSGGQNMRLHFGLSSTTTSFAYYWYEFSGTENTAAADITPCPSPVIGVFIPTQP